ncbi:MAG: hypothetical protein ACP5D2_05205, partial [Candidatus Nanoarchaeia archaeon]
MKLLDSIDEDFLYAEIGNSTKQGDVIPERLNLEDRNELVADYFKKIDKGDIQKVELGNILLAKVRPNLKKYILIDDEKEKYFYTTAFINLKPKKLGRILYYSLRTIFYKNLMAIARQGKGYPTLKEDDLYTLRFDKKIIDKLELKQDQIVAQIEPIEQKIKDLKEQIKEPQEIINKVFAREFGFDLEKFETLKKEKFFEVDFSIISKFDSLRKGVKNYKKNYEYLFDFLSSIQTTRLSKIFSHIRNSLAPELENEGNYKVVKIAQLRNGYIDYDNCESVSDIFFPKNKE